MIDCGLIDFAHADSVSHPCACAEPAPRVSKVRARKSAGVRAADGAGGARTVAFRSAMLVTRRGYSDFGETWDRRQSRHASVVGAWPEEERGRCPDFGSSSFFSGTTEVAASIVCPASPTEREASAGPHRDPMSKRPRRSVLRNAPVVVERSADSTGNRTGATASGAESGAPDLPGPAVWC